MKKLHITVESLSYLLKQKDKTIKFLGSLDGLSENDVLKIAKYLIENNPITAPIAWRAKYGDVWEVSNQDMTVVINLLSQNTFFENRSIFLDLEDNKLFFENTTFSKENVIKFNELEVSAIYKNREISKKNDAVILEVCNVLLDTNFAVYYVQSENRI